MFAGVWLIDAMPGGRYHLPSLRAGNVIYTFLRSFFVLAHSVHVVARYTGCSGWRAVYALADDSLCLGGMQSPRPMYRDCVMWLLQDVGKPAERNKIDLWVWQTGNVFTQHSYRIFHDSTVDWGEVGWNRRDEGGNRITLVMEQPSSDTQPTWSDWYSVLIEECRSGGDISCHNVTTFSPEGEDACLRGWGGVCGSGASPHVTVLWCFKSSGGYEVSGRGWRITGGRRLTFVAFKVHVNAVKIMICTVAASMGYMVDPHIPLVSICP